MAIYKVAHTRVDKAIIGTAHRRSTVWTCLRKKSLNKLVWTWPPTKWHTPVWTCPRHKSLKQACVDMAIYKVAHTRVDKAIIGTAHRRSTVWTCLRKKSLNKLVWTWPPTKWHTPVWTCPRAQKLKTSLCGLGHLQSGSYLCGHGHNRHPPHIPQLQGISAQ